MELKKIRDEFNITQEQASFLCAVPLRTYIRYENNNTYGNKNKRNIMCNTIINRMDELEEISILTTDYIKNTVKKFFDSYNGEVEYAILFGSYARNEAKINSDVDLIIKTSLKGMNFVGAIELLRIALHKKLTYYELQL